MIRIETFTTDYLQGVIDVILPVQQKEFGIDITLEKQPDLTDIPGYYQKNRGNFWLALDSEKVIGTISVLDIGNGRGALRKMFVTKSYRGAPHHTGALLLQELLNWCRANAFEEIFLGTTSKFLAAHRFYEKNGFSRMDKEALPQTFPVMSVDTVFFQICYTVSQLICVSKRFRHEQMGCFVLSPDFTRNKLRGVKVQGIKGLQNYRCAGMLTHYWR